jgi:hypothetical protein
MDLGADTLGAHAPEPEGQMMMEALIDHRKCWCGSKVRTTPGAPPTSECIASPLHAPFATGKREKHSILYIAGPMTGYEEANYPAFNEAARVLQGAGYQTVNPVDVHEPEQCHYVDLLREDIIMMLTAHGVAVLDNWWESTGARNEVQVAGILKMPVRTVSEWLERASQELS